MRGLKLRPIHRPRPPRHRSAAASRPDCNLLHPPGPPRVASDRAGHSKPPRKVPQRSRDVQQNIRKILGIRIVGQLHLLHGRSDGRPTQVRKIRVTPFSRVTYTPERAIPPKEDVTAVMGAGRWLYSIQAWAWRKKGRGARGHRSFVRDQARPAEKLNRGRLLLRPFIPSRKKGSDLEKSCELCQQ